MHVETLKPSRMHPRKFLALKLLKQTTVRATMSPREAEETHDSAYRTAH
jgi:hypothetical protein